MVWYLSLYCRREGSYHPGFDLEKGKSLIMRIPVVDTRGVALMPCTPTKARHLFKSGAARPKRNKLGLLFVQLCYQKEHLYKLLSKMGLILHLCRGHQTKELREKYGLKKTKSKSKQSFDSH